MADRDIFLADPEQSPPSAPSYQTPPESGGSAKLGPAGWAALVVLFGFLAVTGWYAVHGWGTLQGVGVSTTGWILMIGGVVATLALGGGLMALIFYSSRKGKDF